MTEEINNEITWIELGSAEYPIPIGAEYDKDGKVITIKWLQSDEDAIYIPTMRTGETQEQLYGRFIRDVVSDPVLLRSMEEIIRRTDITYADKDEKSASVTMIGDPGCGKTFMASRIAELLHPKGAFKVDCGILTEPEALYQVTVLNAGSHNKVQAVKAFIERGNNPETEVEIPGELVAKLAKEFGTKYVNTENRDGRKFVEVDFNGIADAYSGKHIEQVMSEVIEKFDIPYEAEQGGVGISYRNGPLIRALVDPSSTDYGRPVILDESNRLPEVDAWLTISAFFSDPNVDKLVLRGEDNREFTIYRKDLPENFLLIGTANPATDEMGSSAQTMSRPMVSRAGANIDIITSGRAKQHDFFSRSLKHFTGVPAYMVYMINPEYYDKHPDELAEKLMYLRVVGLEGVDNPHMWAAKLLANPYLREENMPESIKTIPKDELFNIKHIDRTIHVARNYGTLLYETAEMVENLIKDEDIAPTYRNYLSELGVVDLRYAFKLFQHTQTHGASQKTENKPIAVGNKTKTQETIQMLAQQRAMERKVGKKFTRGTMLDIGTVERVKNILKPDNYYDFLDTLTDEEIKATSEKVYAATKKIIEIAKNKCHFKHAGYEGSDSVANLYNAKPEDFEESVEAKEIAKILIDSINDAMGTDLKVNDINGEEALKLLETLIAKDENDNTVIVPSHEPDDYTRKSFKPFQRTKVTSSDSSDIDPTSLATVDQFMDSMIVDKAREHNLKKIMAQAKQNMQQEITLPEGGDADVEPLKKILSGENPDIFVSVVLLQDNADKTKDPESKFAILLYNKKQNRMGIVSSFDVSESDHTKLKEKGIIVINADKEDIGPEFMNYIKADNPNISDQEIFKSIYLVFFPDFINTDESDGVSVWNSIGSSQIAHDIQNLNQLCRIEKTDSRDREIVQAMQSKLGIRR